MIPIYTLHDTYFDMKKEEKRQRIKDFSDYIENGQNEVSKDFNIDLDVTTIYNDFLIRLEQLHNELQSRSSTIIKNPITMINLVRLLYFGQYNPQNVDEEERLINQLCYLNKIDNFHFITGKIFY